MNPTQHRSRTGSLPTGRLSQQDEATKLQRLLVIKLGALGNVVLSLAAFAAIRRHHADAHITLLTTAPFADWLRSAPYFDEVWVDDRANWWNVPGWLALRRRLVRGRFDRIYDLQTSSRSNRYFQFLPRLGRPEWSGVAPACSHPDRDPQRDRLHDALRQANQLRQAGIAHVPEPDLGWSAGDLKRFRLPSRFALLVPGSSAHRPAKRWPAARFGALAQAMAEAGMTPVVLGTAGESGLAALIAKIAPTTIDLTGRTDYGDLASLGRAAGIAVGNDTGPMHLVATAGCPSLVLFSHDSDPALCAPVGRCVRVLRRPSLDQLELAAVRDAALALLAAGAAVR